MTTTADRFRHVERTMGMIECGCHIDPYQRNHVIEQLHELFDLAYQLGLKDGQLAALATLIKSSARAGGAGSPVSPRPVPSFERDTSSSTGGNAEIYEKKVQP